MILSLLVGIDISANSCEVVLIDHQGKQIGPFFSIPNNREGAYKICERIKSATKPLQIKDIEIGLEATSVYG